MNKERIALSFFKESKIDYYYNKKANTITFPCFKCDSNAIMNVFDTSWYCFNNCSDGNIFNLIHSNKNDLKEKTIYNPVKEYKRMEYRFNKLIKSGYQDVEELKDIVYGLINYYKNTV